MFKTPEQLDIIADTLAEDLKDEPINVLSNGRYVVLVSNKYGLATIVGDQNANYVHKSALEIARQAGLIGISTQVNSFIVSDKPDNSDNIFLRPNAIALDLKSALMSLSGGKDVLSWDDANRFTDFLNGNIRSQKKVVSQKIPPIDPSFKKLMLNVVIKALGEHKPWVVGCKISPEHLVAEDFMLGPLLVAAAENWTAPFLAANQQGGFTIGLEKADKSENTMLGFKVVGLDMAAPSIVLINLASTIRRYCNKGACDLDPCIDKFIKYVCQIYRRTDIFDELGLN